MLAVIDYDAGNIKSVENAFKYLRADICVTRDPKEIMRADRVILPGVGAFGDAMNKLNEYKKVLKLRNDILKNENIDNILLNVTTEKLIDLAKEIIKFRYEFIKELNENLCSIILVF